MDEAGTRIDEVADGIYRISTPLAAVPGGFTFNQYLVVDDEPLLFHTGLRRIFPSVRDAIARVMPVEKLRWVAFSHLEQDECGALNEFLAAAPRAEAACSRIGAMTSVGDLAIRPPRPLADGERLSLGRHEVVWHDAPHVPHGWDCGFLSEATTRTLLCGDLFTQPGASHSPLTESDILGPSEAMRGLLDYYAHAPATRATLEKLAATGPRTLACMHGAAWHGDGATLLAALADALERRA
ncbi:oxygen-binding di-iron domain-containing protein [Anaeromyxobacter terrae]|uniref:MBL fold metallo-hydrolase n=1 Tax=Anaeromyxobacter terrae TaxID=2925406 RepID=UPI001F57A85C|nr:MBL fold metallo-hydrolase [Anaeromyxobacter sp. SG22]